MLSRILIQVKLGLTEIRYIGQGSDAGLAALAGFRVGIASEAFEDSAQPASDKVEITLRINIPSGRADRHRAFHISQGGQQSFHIRSTLVLECADTFSAQKLRTVQLIPGAFALIYAVIGEEHKPS